MAKTFEKGKEYMEEAANSVELMEKGLQGIDKTFESIAASVEEQTASTEEVAEKISELNDGLHKVKEVCLALGKDICGLSENMNAARVKYEKSGHVSNSVIIDVAKTDHLMWRWRVYNMLLGYCTFDSNKVKDPSLCNLGKWLNNKEATASFDANLLQSLHKPHHALHAAAVTAIDAFNSGDEKSADKALSDMDKISKEVVAILDELKDGI